jgi:hypothetical protein
VAAGNGCGTAGHKSTSCLLSCCLRSAVTRRYECFLRVLEEADIRGSALTMMSTSRLPLTSFAFPQLGRLNVAQAL